MLFHGCSPFPLLASTLAGADFDVLFANVPFSCCQVLRVTRPPLAVPRPVPRKEVVMGEVVVRLKVRWGVSSAGVYHPSVRTEVVLPQGHLH
jgi:hypothetical protein